MNFVERGTIEPPVSRVVYEKDGMLPRDGDIEKYLAVGRRTIKAIVSAHAIAGIEPPKSILDYGSGAGRMLRWLRAWRPEAEIYAADIKEDAIAFCQQEFGAVPFLVDRPFRELSIPATFDCIWLGSVYTHIDKSGWSDLTDVLLAHLSPNGLLCFSFSGRTVYRAHKSGRDKSLKNSEVAEAMIRGYEQSGFGFIMPRAHESLDPWGRALARLDFLSEFLDRKELDVILYSERAYGKRQDVVCAKRR